MPISPRNPLQLSRERIVHSARRVVAAPVYRVALLVAVQALTPVVVQGADRALRASDGTGAPRVDVVVDEVVCAVVVVRRDGTLGARVLTTRSARSVGGVGASRQGHHEAEGENDGRDQGGRQSRVFVGSSALRRRQ